MSLTPDCRTVLVCSNYAWTVLNFRKGLLLDIKSAGYQVHVLTQFDGYEKKLADLGFKVHPLFISRKGVNPFTDLITFLNLLFAIRRVGPDACLLFTIKPVLYAGFASAILRVPYIPMITGLGTAFIQENWITTLVKFLYRGALRRARHVYFQNEDDKALFLEHGLVKPSASISITPGSGIDLKYFSYNEQFPEVKKFLFVGRLIEDKGIREFVEAASRVKRNMPHVQFMVVGELGAQNRTAIKSELLNQWVASGHITYLGVVDDVRPVIEDASCVVLPSYREGTARVLLEACALGRPVVAADVPGCRELVVDEKNGFLCEARDANSLYIALLKILACNDQQLREMGVAGRSFVEENYSSEVVAEMYKTALSSLVRPV